MFSMKKDSRGILSLKECLAIGVRLKMSQEDVEAASIFFHCQSSLLYICHILPNLVVTRPQTPLDWMNAVVKLSYKVGFGEMKGVSENIVSSLKDGIITEEILSHKEITQSFIPGLYEPQHAIELLSHTFTLAPLSRDTQPNHLPLPPPLPYSHPPSPGRRKSMMMSLRSAIPEKDIPQQLPSVSDIIPLLVQFTNDCVPFSCFCRTISCLMAIYDWKLSSAHPGAPLYLAHNVVSLSTSLKHQVRFFWLTLASISRFTLTKGKDSTKITLPRFCFQVKEMIINAIKHVFHRLNLSGIEAIPALFCPGESQKVHHSPCFYLLLQFQVDPKLLPRSTVLENPANITYCGSIPQQPRKRNLHFKNYSISK